MRNLMFLSTLLAGHAFCEAAEASVASAPAASAKEKPVVEKVRMEDGREVEFSGKRKLLKESFVDKSAGTVCTRLDFRNGKVLTFDVVASGLLLEFAAHGAEQKLGDETAGTEDVDDMVLDVAALVERLSRGEWSTKREGGFAGSSVLIKALLRFAETQGKSKTEEEVAAFVKSKTPAERTALKNSPKIKPIVDALEAEKVAKSAKVDTDALLSGL